MSNLLKKAWGYLQSANNYWDDKTQPVHGDSTNEKITSLTTYFKYDSDDKQELSKVEAEDGGKEFIYRKVNDVNRNASHRTAFVANALFQLLIVNVSSFSLLSFVPASWFKILLIGANLAVAFIAWRRLRNSSQIGLFGGCLEAIAANITNILKS